MIRVLHERWRPNPLAWIHRAEARSVAAEFARFGMPSRLQRFDTVTHSDDTLLLRLSDPVMFEATKALTKAAIRYLGPGAAVMERCYDKLEATRIVRAAGVDCPDTWLASEAAGAALPLILKPRRGSDSIGVRVLQDGAIPERFRHDGYIAQRLVRGTEITVGLLHDRVGQALHIQLPEGVPYSFARKYLAPARRGPLDDEALAARVRSDAIRIARALGVDWAARIDFIHERTTDLLYFLECDVAPLVGPGSAFDTSLRATGIARDELLKRLIG